MEFVNFWGLIAFVLFVLISFVYWYFFVRDVFLSDCPYCGSSHTRRVGLYVCLSCGGTWFISTITGEVVTNDYSNKNK